MPTQSYMLDPAGLPPLPDGPIYTPAPPAPQPGALYGNTQRPMDGIPQFEMVSVLTADGSYKNVEFVNILTPGDTKSMPRQKVADLHRQKYRPWYEAWRRGLEMAPEGSPIEMWPMMTPAQVRHLKSVNIFTVEQLANIGDGFLHQIPMGATLRQQAQAWIKEKKTADDIEGRRRSEQLMQDTQRMMETQMQAMATEIERLKAGRAPEVPAPVEPTKRGLGRPPNAKPIEAT